MPMSGCPSLLDANIAGNDNGHSLTIIRRGFYAVSPKLQEELLSEMARLSQEEQQRVVAFAKSLAAGPTGKASKDVARFAGAIDPDDLKQMAAVIEEGCERINESEW